ncbi:class I SAM-dependent methyltransferase [Calditrichota bacterium LG25]
MSIKSHASNFFFPIIDNWPEYFDDPHEGLGTTYERFLLHEFFAWLDKNFPIERVLEAPSFGMTGASGINSLWWAKKGRQVTVVDNHETRLNKARALWQGLNLKAQFCLTGQFEALPFKDQAFDLSWNFASLWFVGNLAQFAKELDRLTRRVIFICVPNRFGLGYQLRLHWPGSTRPDLNFEAVKTSNIRQEFEKHGWQLRRKGYFDIPPWPDFPLKKEVLFDKLKIGFLLKWLSKNEENAPQAERMTILDYFSGKRPDLKEEVFRFRFLEGAPLPIRWLWAHHQYLIFSRD